MCGIAGFSLNDNSRVNARALAHALLSAIEVRGRMSSGIAYPGRDGGIEVYKDAVAGSNLPLKTVPRNTKTAILHTRYATKGSPQDNTNNHPVWSPFQTIALVHNGVIWNDMSLRFGELKELDEFMPMVDTACIPALLESKGLEGVKSLAGDAAVAWLDIADAHTLHLARIESSPVAYTNLMDGSFVFASTPSLLREALASLSLEHGQIFNLGELDYYKMRGGVIWEYEAVPAPQGYGQGWAASTRGATSGGHSTRQSGQSSYVGQSTTGFQPPAVKSETKNEGGSLFSVTDKGEVLEVDDTLTEEEALAKLEEKAMALIKEEAENSRTIYSMEFKHPEIDEGEEGWAGLPKFYTVDTDSNMESYDSLEELETKLLYLAGRNSDEAAFGNGKVKWVNHFSDIGSFTFDGDLVSWLDNPNELSSYGSELDYVKDGVSLLAGMAGR